jgi:predicted NUDIX family NTP pyrophosphohydrolase
MPDGNDVSRAPRARSAGILLYRDAGDVPHVLLVHPGGPLWARRDAGAWSIPKGEYVGDEDPLAAARREFQEELGVAPPEGPAEDLGEIRQRSGKHVHAWALPGEVDVSALESNTFELEWPPRSGKKIEVPEVDRAQWFPLDVAREKINPGQLPLLDRLERMLESDPR